MKAKIRDGSIDGKSDCPLGSGCTGGELPVCGHAVSAGLVPKKIGREELCLDSHQRDGALTALN